MIIDSILDFVLLILDGLENLCIWIDKKKDEYKRKRAGGSQV